MRMRLMMPMATLMMATLTACDYANKREQESERDNRAYRTAMADFSAGRMEQAIAGLEKVVAEFPGNASARFQLACLLQDVKKDWIGAFCAYREYLQQRPKSDKDAMAKTRMEECSRKMAELLVEKYGLINDDAKIKELEVLRKEVAGLRAKDAIAVKESETLRLRNEALVTERDRLLGAIRGDDGMETKKPSVKVAKDLLEEEETEIVDRVAMSKDVAMLRNEEGSEAASGSVILAERKPEDLKKREEAERLARERSEAEAAYLEANKHPPTYVVQEGDTLYRIAVRFYGRISAWSKIRDANKAVISNDGRVKAGVTIKLP